jgi:hypothetical protein
MTSNLNEFSISSPTYPALSTGIMFERFLKNMMFENYKNVANISRIPGGSNFTDFPDVLEKR